MNYWIEGAPDDLREVLKRVDVLIINDSEARELSGEANLVKAARAIRAMGPKTVVIKRGEHGVLMTCPGEGEFFAAPALPLEEVFDPTGAGDTFAGGFIGSLAACGEITAGGDGARHHLRQHAGVVRGGGLQPGSAPSSDARRDSGPLPPLQAPDAFRRGLARRQAGRPFGNRPPAPGPRPPAPPPIRWPLVGAGP